MIPVAQLQAQIAKQFPNAAIIGDRAVRIEKTSGDAPYAVLYFDANDELPTDDEALRDYVDNLIGPDYFRGPKSLQWSNYLYFLTKKAYLNTQEGVRAKQLVEADRRYARKFVIPEEDLERVLSTPAASQNSGKRSTVFTAWIEELEKAGLDGAILGDDDMPTRLAGIERTVKPPFSQPKVNVSPPLAIPAFIRNIELLDYRLFPAQRVFEFGTVNLIVGPNATGKTSLLEAIELYYCGRNKRGGIRPPSYQLKVNLADGRHEFATGNRDLSEFRTKNLIWYGQPEVKTHSIDQSFAKFNFLNTDAAVNISDSMQDIEDVLSKLLIGPDASKIWHSMVRVRDALTAKVRELKRNSERLTNDLDELNRTVAAQGPLQTNSGVLLARLSDILAQQNWATLQNLRNDAEVSELYSSLSEFAIVANQAASLGWLQAPVTLQQMMNYCSSADREIPRLEELCDALDQTESDLRSNQSDLDASRSIRQMLQGGKTIIDSGLIAATDEEARLHSSLANDSRTESLVHFSEEDIALIDEAGAKSRSLEEMKELAIQWVVSADLELEERSKDHEKFSSLRDASFNLTQQLRQIASAILNQQAAKDVCPLCHTPFADGELTKHISQDGHSELDAAAQALLSRLDNARTAALKSKRFSDLMDRLDSFLTQSGASSSNTVGQALEGATAVRLRQATTQARIIELRAEISALEQSGFTLEDFRAFVDQLASHSVQIISSSEQIAGQLSKCDLRIETLTQLRLELAKRRSALNVELSSTLGTAADLDPRVIVRLRRDRSVVTSKLVAEMEQFMAHYPWPRDASIAELIVGIDAVRTFISDVRNASNEELKRSDELARSQKRRLDLETEQNQLNGQLATNSDALAVLETLTKAHDLQSAMQESLDQNREGIETIFLRIHSPDEFAGLGTTFSSLRRKNGEVAQLTEISTGQRAAYALSIFLAQNAQLAGGPPVMLIDDPIAHIDDLNSLSFLDHLRELVLRGDRQIFFATANEKIATLFARKFDFLGSQFRKIQLARE